MKALEDELHRVQTAIGDLTTVVAHVRNDIGIIRSIADAATTAANAQAIGLEATRDRLRQLELSVRSKAGRCQQRHNAVHNSGTSALDDVERTAIHQNHCIARLEKKLDRLALAVAEPRPPAYDQSTDEHALTDDRLHPKLTVDAAKTVIDTTRDDAARRSGPRPATPSEQVPIG